MIASATIPTLLTDQADQAFNLLRLAWLLLGLTGVGLFGVILLAVVRRSYVRSQRPARSQGEPLEDGPDSDAWAESARRMAVNPHAASDSDSGEEEEDEDDEPDELDDDEARS